MLIHDPAALKIVWPWLHGGIPSAGQLAWGAAQLDAHAFVALPSVVTKPSWNAAFRPDRAAAKCTTQGQDRLVLDTRLNPPAR